MGMANNRVAADVNFTEISQELEGYTGSDIKEVCRDAVVRGAHELAQKLDSGESSDSNPSSEPEPMDSEILRPVSREDFTIALKKLSASVSEKGKELSRVLDWNDEYGEIKKKKKRPNL